MTAAPLPKLENFKSVFLVKPSSLGDIVHTLPAAHLLKQAHPHLQIRWLSNPEWMPLLEGNTDLAEVIPFPRGRFRGLESLPRMFGWARGLNANLRELPELALDFQGLLRSALLCQARGVTPIVGMSDAREGATFFYNHVVPVDPAAHAVDRYLELVRTLGIEVTPDRVPFPLPQGARPEGEIPEGYLLLHPFSRGKGKSLSHESIQALCDCLFPHPVIIAGKCEDAAPVKGIHVFSLLNKTTLGELIWLTRHAHACVSVDSGPMHIAASLQDRTLGIHTWSDPRQVGPYNLKAKIWKAGRVAHRLDFTDQEATTNRAVAPGDVRRIADVILGEWY